MACALVGFMPQPELSVQNVVLLLFLIQFQLSCCDLLTEAKYAERMQAKPDQGPNLMTFVWFGLQFGGLIATIAIGPVLTRFGPKVPFMVAVVPLAYILWPLSKNYMEEVVQSRQVTEE